MDSVILKNHKGGNYMKKILSVFLVCLMVLCLLPVRAEAAQQEHTLDLPLVHEPASLMAAGDIMVEESEPNNTWDTADHITNDYTMYGIISPSTDSDYYQFTLTNESMVYIDCAATYSYATLKLYSGASQTFLTESEYLGTSDGLLYSGIGAYLAPGSYYLVVTNTSGLEQEYLFYTEIIDMTTHVHNWEFYEAVAPTCSESGGDIYVCYDCGLAEARNIVEPTGDHPWDAGTVMVQPSCTVQGNMLYTCTYCGTFYEEALPKLPHDYVDGYCSVCRMEQPPFPDVVHGEFYYMPVKWALENGITTGLTPDSFGPNQECTRGQIVTFLWRTAGSPEPSSTNNPFKDVKSSDFFYKAVLWAVEENITAGYGSDDIFNPNGICTRGQVATFLHRYFDEPAPTGTNPFTDVKTGAYYYDAVLWAVEKDITNGYGSATIFNPDGNCTRGQIVTFLYRAIG